MPAGGVGIEFEAEIHAIDVAEPDSAALDAVPVDSHKTGTLCLGIFGGFQIFVIHNEIGILFGEIEPGGFGGAVDFSFGSFDGALILVA